VPSFAGHPLDPPLRSRFQAKKVEPPSVSDYIVIMEESCGQTDNFFSVIKISDLLRKSDLPLPFFPSDIDSLIPLLKNNQINLNFILHSLYPYTL
jgi:hypothetical protein